MVAPSITGITRINASSTTGNWVLAAVAGATNAIPSSATSATLSLDGTNAVRLQNGSTAGVVGNTYSAYASFSSVDISTSGAAIGIHIAAATRTFLSLDSDGFRLFLLSDGGTANYAVWNIGGQNDLPSIMTLFVLGDTAPDATGGTFNPANVTAIGVIFKAATTGTFTLNVAVDQIISISPLVYSGGEGGNIATIEKLYTATRNTASTAHSLIIDKLDNFYSLRASLRIANDLFQDSQFAFGFSSASAIQQIPDDYYSLEVVAATSGSITISNAQINASNYELNVAPAASATVSLSSASFFGAGATDFTQGSGTLSVRGGTFSGRGSISITGGTFRDATFSENETITVSGAEVVSNVTIPSTTNAGDVALIFNGAPGDYSDWIVDIGDSLVVNITQGAGTYTLTGLTGGTELNPVVFDNTGGGAVVVVVGSGIDAVTASPVTSGTLTIQAPVATTTFTGFPTANNANGVAPAPVIGFYSSASAAGFIAALSTADPEYSAGSFTVLLSDYPGVTHVVGDAMGWIRTDYIPVDALNPPSSVSLAAAFREIVSETGVALVGNGTVDGKAKLTYDQANTRFEVAAGPITFADALDKKEELTSTVAGLENFETAVVRGIQFISSKYGNEILLPSPLTIAAAANAATSPILEDFLVVRAGGPTADPFDHGLASTAPGLTDRPEVRMISTLFISGSSGDGVTIDAQDVADALKLAPTAGTPAAGSVYAELDSLLAGTGGSLSYDLPQFIGLMRADVAFKRALSEAALVAGLADELPLVKTQVWTRADVRTAWNKLIINAGVTAPSVGEVAAWNSYAALLPGLSFAANGEVSYAG